MNEQISLGRTPDFLTTQLHAVKNSGALAEQELLINALESHLGREWEVEDAQECRMEELPRLGMFADYRFYYRDTLLGTMHVGDIEFSFTPDDIINNTMTASSTIQFIPA